MIIFKVPLVIPTRGLWVLVLFLIGIFGLIAQVCSPIALPSARLILVP
jgi:hypothetical protein